MLCHEYFCDKTLDIVKFSGLVARPLKQLHFKVSRAPSRSESRSSIVGYRAKSAAQSERVSSAQEKRTTASLSRKSSFIGQKVP